MAAKKSKPSEDYEIWTVTYQTPKFGCEGEYNPELWHMMIGSCLGRDDAKETCLRFHKGCRVICSLNRGESAADLERDFLNKLIDKKKK